jgi:hypothetical protein
MLEFFIILFNSLIILSCFLFVFLLLVIEQCINHYVIFFIILYIIYKFIQLRKGGDKWYSQLKIP